MPNLSPGRSEKTLPKLLISIVIKKVITQRTTLSQKQKTSDTFDNLYISNYLLGSPIVDALHPKYDSFLG